MVLVAFHGFVGWQHHKTVSLPNGPVQALPAVGRLWPSVDDDEDKNHDCEDDCHDDDAKDGEIPNHHFDTPVSMVSSNAKSKNKLRNERVDGS